MRPMQLLTVGNSIHESKDHPHRYKMTQRNLLPKFGMEKNAPPQPATTEERIKKNMKIEMAEMAPLAPVKTSAPGPAVFPLGRWTFKRNPFASRAVTVAVQPVVQSELSLDAVKVVRNDLSDADLELVPLMRGASTFVPRVQAKPHAITRMWERLTAQLFGAGKA